MIQDLIRERKEASASASNPNTAWQIAKLNNQVRPRRYGPVLRAVHDCVGGTECDGACGRARRSPRVAGTPLHGRLPWFPPQARALEERIEKERERVKILDKEIKEGQDEIINQVGAAQMHGASPFPSHPGDSATQPPRASPPQRKKMGGINAARENNAQVQKQIKVLENRLEKAYVKDNEAVAHNKRLREQIDSLR